MQARCFCPEHGRLEFDDIRIKNGLPTCAKCAKPLEFGIVRPRPVAKPKLIVKPNVKRRTRRR